MVCDLRPRIHLEEIEEPHMSARRACGEIGHSVKVASLVIASEALESSNQLPYLCKF